MSKVALSDYKGSPVLQLINDEDVNAKYPFSFGLKKAKLILAHIEDIKKFVEQQDKTPKKPGEKLPF